MNRFAPPRVSSPAKPSVVARARVNSNTQDTLSTSSLPPELQGLTTEEISFIDEVVSHASPNSNHFLTVFKAYNDILAERGVNPGDEVVYYGKLLKLGTLKGASWAEKWDWVKSLQGGPSTLKPAVSAPANGKNQGLPRKPTQKAGQTNGRTAIFTRLTGTLKSIERDEDAFTLHSHQDEYTDETEPEPMAPTEGSGGTSYYIPQHRDTPRPNRRAPSPALTAASTNTLGLNIGPPASAYKSVNPAPVYQPSRRELPARAQWKTIETSEESDTVASPSTVPPSYGAATRGHDLPQRQRGSYAPPRNIPKAPSKATSTTLHSASPIPQSISAHGHLTPASAREVVLRAKERSKSVVNEDEAWEKIRRDQDEKEADRFREEKLMERCWEVWKQGYEWIHVTSEQIAQARDIHILRLAIHRWRSSTAQRLELYHRVASLSNSRVLKLALAVWKQKFLKRRQEQWRADMRNRMKLVREKHEFGLLRDAWIQWRQAQEMRLADVHYERILMKRYLRVWKDRLQGLDQLNAACDVFVMGKDDALVEGCWDLWRRGTEMRRAERVVTDKVALRVVGKAFDVWKSHMGLHDVADQFYDVVLVKRMFGAWKAARDRIRSLERRADKHVARQNVVLVRAVMRVWGAHERGRLLERVKSARLLKTTFALWKERLHFHRDREATALVFSQRPSSVLALSALQRWHRALNANRQASEYAILYHNSQMQYRYLMTWRLRLRAQLKMARQAKMVEKLLVMRNAFRKWLAKLQEKRREEKVKLFERKLVKGYFDEWRERVKKEQELRLIEHYVRDRADRRVMSRTIMHWINRVSDQKDRELRTTDLYEQVLVVTTFRKWADRWTTRVNEKSLLQSFRDIKREEKLRRAVYRWLALARQARHKRLLLEEKEQEFRLNRMEEAWGKWRDRIQDRRLQPLADEYTLTRQTGLVFRAFGIWHAKTKSLPAIHFYNSHLKAKVWKAWRDSVPNPAQSKMARDKYQKALLTKMFAQWSQAYKAKMALKAVARARYLRLPLAVSRQSTSQPRALGPTPTSSISSYRRPLSRPGPEPEIPSATETEEESDVPPPVPPTRFGRGRTGISSFLASRPPPRSVMSEEITSRRPRAPTSVTSSRRPKFSTRAPSPTASVVSDATQVFSEVAAPSQAASSSGGGLRRTRLLQELESRGFSRSRPFHI